MKFDDREELLEGTVGSALVVDGQLGHHHEAGPLHELRVTLRPFDRLLIREFRIDEEFVAALVADVPRIEVGDPTL